MFEPRGRFLILGTPDGQKGHFGSICCRVEDIEYRRMSEHLFVKGQHLSPLAEGKG